MLLKGNEEFSLNIPPHIYVALGAVTAALIAGYFSFVGLISAKEGKVSEFRQSWIDAFRSELSEYVSTMRALATLLESAIEASKRRRYRNGELVAQDELTDEERELFVREHKDYFSKITSNFHSIELRVNPKEEAEGEKYHLFMKHLRAAHGNREKGHALCEP